MGCFIYNRFKVLELSVERGNSGANFTYFSDEMVTFGVNTSSNLR